MERVQAREALEHHRALLADAERLAHLGNWQWDIVRNKVTWSDEMHRIYGLSRDKFGGSYEAFLTRVHPGDRDKVAAIIQEAYEKKIPFRFHHRIIRPDGQEATLLAQGKPVLNDAGELVRMIGTGQDVTEQKENEYRLAHQAEQIAALSEMGQTTTVTLELEIVFEKVLEKLMPLLGASSVNILLLEGSDLVFAAGSDDRDRELVGKRVVASASLADEVLRTGRPIGLYGQEAEERVFHQIIDSAGNRPGALLVAPLKLRSEIIGVIEAVYPETAVFDDED
jgi:PAS domain S-box-containing protein